jgi:hypothetical protein
VLDAFDPQAENRMEKADPELRAHMKDHWSDFVAILNRMKDHGLCV